MSDGRDELRQLVRSLDDLDAEFAAGDLDEADYRTLRDDYTVRVAEAVRRTGSDPGTPTPAVITKPAAAPDRQRWVVLAALAVFAIGAGWLLARSAGERGLNDALTGGIDRSSRQRVADCQQIGMTDGDLLGAIQCFDEVLTSDPDNVEALTYRAWFLVLASSGGDSTTEAQQAELLNAAAVYLDRAITVDPAYPDARTFRAVVADRQGDRTEACAQIEALVDLDPAPFFLQQSEALAERNGCEP